MSSVFDTMIRRKYVCDCGAEKKEIRWGKDPLPICDCGKTMDEVPLHFTNAASAVHGDEIDITIRHGICNEDGSPRRYRSKSEMQREAARRGYVLVGETPHPERSDKYRDS